MDAKKSKKQAKRPVIFIFYYECLVFMTYVPYREIDLCYEYNSENLCQKFV